MKTRKIPILFILGLLIMYCSPKEENNKITYKDPVIERADIVYDSSEGLCPGVVATANGELIAFWGTGWGDGMPDQTTQFARSLDSGKTWSEPYMTMESQDSLAGLAAILFNVPDGNWTIGRLMRYTMMINWTKYPDPTRADWPELTATRKFDSYYSFSSDQGYTFSERKLLSDPVKRNDFAQGKIIELPNGELLWPWGSWGAEPLNGFRRSTDGGNNWEPVERAWQDPPPGFDKPVVFNETAGAVCKDGTIVAVARVDGLPDNDKRFWQIKSHDNGKSWTTPRQIEIAGGSPAMYCTPQGQLWLAYRDGGFGPGLGFAVSDDNGENWRFLYHLQDPKGEFEEKFSHIRYTDEDRKKPWRPAEGIVGYPWFAQIFDTEVYVVYHMMNSDMKKISPEAPFYIVGNLLRIPE
ncbi:exo-alpha-sialidase [Mariniphaga sediminis]|nr:sialidase family protein [Mariniphaga sediminis]